MSLSQAVLQTLAYSDYFNFPLTADEIRLRLIGVRVSPLTLKRALTSLVRAKKIGHKQGFYFLPSRTSVVARRNRRFTTSSKLLKRAESLTKKIRIVPGILAIYLTGSLAVNNSTENDDIDLMIITKSGKLWTTRLFLTLYTTALALRRTPSSKRISGKLCLNLYLTPSSLSLPSSRRSLYAAYELIQAVPLYDPHDTHSQLLISNKWVSKYLPNYQIPNSAKIRSLQSEEGNLFERLAYHLQLSYMRPKITRELITRDSAFFHPLIKYREP